MKSLSAGSGNGGTIGGCSSGRGKASDIYTGNNCTLADCIGASGPRVCLFAVAGTIDREWTITNGNLTIDGRSAPGGGIQLINSSGTNPLVTLGASDVVIRGLRLRPTIDTVSPGDDSEKRTLRVYNDIGSVTQMVFDHNSMEWGNGTPIDLFARGTSFTPPSEITFSWNMMGENFWINGYGAAFSRTILWGCGSGGASQSRLVCEQESAGMVDVDLHHNIIASDGYRNPDYRGNRGRIINNYLYNWGLHGFEIVGTVVADIVGNTFYSGPMHNEGYNVEGHGVNNPIELDVDGNSTDNDWSVGLKPPYYYIAGNVTDVPVQDDGTQNLTSGIATLCTKYGGCDAPKPPGKSSKYIRSTPLAPSRWGFEIEVDEASAAVASMLESTGAGASYRLDCGGNVVPNRDDEDEKIASYIAERTGPSQSPGYLGAPPPPLPVIAPVNAVCSPKSRDNAKCACADIDGDGLPDYWENTICGSSGCDPKATNVAPPWTNLEAYLSGLVSVP